MIYIIYKTTNLINGKIYVGQHNTSADDGYLGSGVLLKKSINKYSRESFNREIIEYCTSSNVNDREIFWIAELSATENGYNIAAGGGGCRGVCRYGEENSNYGNRWSDELRKKVADKRKTLGLSKGENNPRYGKGNELIGELNPFYGKRHICDTKKKISEKCKNYWKYNKPRLLGCKGKNHPTHKYMYKMISPSNVIYENIDSLDDFCVNHNLRTDSVMNAFIVGRLYYKKWKIFRYEI